MTTNEVTTKKPASKNSIDAYGAEGKTNLLMFDPDKLVIVEDKGAMLYDKRIEKPLTPGFIANVDFFGVHTPIAVRKNPETGDVEVVFGRRRVRAARAVNKARREKGLEPMQVPGVIKRGDDGHLGGLMVSENEAREADSPMNRAEKMQKLLNQGKDEAFCAMAFECSPATVKNMLGLLECCAFVRNHVESGAISVTQAYPLHKLSPEEQKATVERMLAAGAGETGKRKRGRKMREAAGGSVMKGKRDIRNFLARVENSSTDPEFRAAAKAVLEWVLGGKEPRIPKIKAA